MSWATATLIAVKWREGGLNKTSPAGRTEKLRRRTKEYHNQLLRIKYWIRTVSIIHLFHASIFQPVPSIVIVQRRGSEWNGIEFLMAPGYNDTTATRRPSRRNGGRTRQRLSPFLTTPLSVHNRINFFVGGRWKVINSCFFLLPH